MKHHTVLCCLNASTLTENVDEYTFYQIFQTQATIKNIKVFKTGTQIKAFVQVGDKESLDRLVDQFHLKCLNIGKLKVFPSHKKFVAYDKSILSILADQNQNQNFKDGLKTSENSLNKIDNATNHYISNILANRLANQSKVDGFENKKFYNFLHNSENSDGYLNSQPYIKFSDFKDPAKNSRNLQLETKSSNKTQGNKILDSEFIPVYNKHNTFTANLLKVDNLDIRVISSQMIMNLFGCFGNVIRLDYHTKEHYAIIQFETDEQAEFALKFVNNSLFFGNTLTLSFTNEQLLNDHDDNEYDIETATGHYKYFRYKDNLKIKINKPSKLLHFTSIAPTITAQILCQLISQIHEPVKLMQLGKKGTNSEMYLIEFRHLFQSLEVLSILHNKKTEGKLLKVSFSHTKIENF